MGEQDAQKVNWSLMALREKRRQEVIQMLKACGVSPEDIPQDTPFHREGRSVFLKRYVRSGNGGILFSESEQGPVVEEIEIQPPPEVIPDWLPPTDPEARFPGGSHSRLSGTEK